LDNPSHEDQVGFLQPRDPSPVVQRRAGEEAPRLPEYIVVHEMAHYFERNHGERFSTLMDVHLPDWRRRRDLLNDAPLSEEKWG
jgi:hypothetical protein